jgi:hypothetical protein
MMEWVVQGRMSSPHETFTITQSYEEGEGEGGR